MCFGFLLLFFGNFATRMVEKKNCVFLITATRMQSTFVVIDTLPVACF